MSTIRAPHVVAAVAVIAVGVWLVARGKTEVTTVETITSVPPAPSATASAASGATMAIAEPTPKANADAGETATAEAPHARTLVSASANPVASAPAAASASAKPVASASAAPSDPLQPSRTRVAGNNFALDVSSPGCRVDTDCTMTIRLAAAGEYHVNKEYPYKFVAQAAPQLAYLGKEDPNTFSRSAGDFREESEKSATMTVRFRPTSPGDAKLSGTYKMSVCSAANCQVETPRIELTVAVK